MRLINVRTQTLEEFIPDEAPPYAILSHRWCDTEVTFADIKSQGQSIKSKDAHFKFQNCCRQALDDGLEYAWIDTCCIDKSSSAELSEAINSMFSWYKNSCVCYAFLNDVPPGNINDESSPCQESFRGSTWFTRGWTLQELLAPAVLRFYSRDWTYIGEKASSVHLIQGITGIYDAFLMNTDLRRACIAERMSWASRRHVTRKEDIAYSLLGIFGINMPLLYGEGEEKAFIRLQEELIKSHNDESLFAWHVPQRLWDERETQSQYLRFGGAKGLLATSPTFFKHCADITQANYGDFPSFLMANGMIQMSLLVEKSANPNNGSVFFTFLRCRKRSDFENVLAIPLALWNGVYYRVWGQPKPVRMNFWKRGHMRKLTVLLSPHSTSPGLNDTGAPFILRTLPKGYTVAAVDPFEATRNDLRSHIISTELTWENLWSNVYSGSDIIRNVHLDPGETPDAPALVLSLKAYSCSMKGQANVLRTKSLITLLKTKEKFSQFVEKPNEINLLQFNKLQSMKPTTRPPKVEPVPLAPYTVTIAVEELICGPALVVDFLDNSSLRAKGEHHDYRTIICCCLSVLVSVTWLLDTYRPVSYMYSLFGVVQPRQLPITWLVVCCYCVLQYLWTVYGSLATGYSLQKAKDYVSRFARYEVLKFFFAELILCWASWAISGQPGYIDLVGQITIVIGLVLLKVPPSLISRPTRYWTH